MPRSRVLLLLLGAMAPGAAWAQVDCTTLPDPLYLSTTTIMKPFYARVATKLASAPDAGDRMTLVYKGNSTCSAYSSVLPPGAKLTGTASYWTIGADGGVQEQTCTFPTAGVDPDLGVGDVTVKTCTGNDPPAGYKQIQTFAQAFGFIVPLNSTQTAITAEEAYFLLKFGAQPGYQVPPWTDPQYIVIRNPNSSTQLTIGYSSGVPGTQWSANLTNTNVGSGDVMAKVAAQNTTGNAEKTIGIMATEVYDVNRDKVKMLAFQAFKQKCLGGGVYPDSTATAFDKKNVRDGHYEIFGYTYAVAAVDGSGNIIKPRARRFIDFMTGTTEINGANPLVDGPKVGSIPTCAMKVKKAYDGAPIEPYDPPTPCGCFFESVVGTTSCTACPSGTCPSGKTCRFGYCEDK